MNSGRNHRRNFVRGFRNAVLFVSALALTTGIGCMPPDGSGNGNGNSNGNSNGNGNNNGGGGGGNIQSLQVVATNLSFDASGEVKVGEDIIAVGTGNESGVQYIIPSRGDVNPLSLSNFDEFVTAGFDLAGNWLMVRTIDGEVGIFNGETEQLTMFDETVLSTFSGAAPPGVNEFWGDGDYFVTLADPNRVADGMAVKVIDLNSGTPVLTSFPNTGITPSPSRENEVSQMALDAPSRQFVVQTTDFIALYSLDDPTGAPQVFDLSNAGGVTNATRIHLDNGYVIYQTFEKTGNGRDVTRILDTNAGTTTQLSENPSRNRPLDIENGVFGYFAHVTDADVSTNDTARAVFGVIGANGPEVTQLNDARTPIGDDPEDGIIAYGCTLAITPDARYRFIAGCGNVGLAEYLQVSTGGAFEVLADQLDADPLDLGLPASEVEASNTLAAFLVNGSMVYIRLPQ